MKSSNLTLRTLGRSRVAIAVVGLTLGLAACNQSDFDDIRGEVADDSDSQGGDDRPGNNAKSTDENVTCDGKDDCLDGETCLDGVCQMQRCLDGPYISEPPLAAGMRFFQDREFVVADQNASQGSYYVDGYAPEPGSIDYPGSWNMGDQKIADVVGGDFFGENPERFAVVQEGSTLVKVGGMDGDVSMDVGFSPIALAAGDVDGDDKDEVIAVGQFGNYALCDVDEMSCKTAFFENGNGKDVGIGDIDNDGVPEAVMLLDQGGDAVLYVLQFDEQDDFYSPANHDIARIDVGDPDGDGVDEIYGFEDDGWFEGAMVYAYSAAAGGEVTEVSSQGVSDASADLTFADLDGDQKDELIVLREGSTIELFRGAEGSYQMTPEFTHQLQVGTNGYRIAAADFDGDSPRTSLMGEEPELVPGPLLPSIVAYFPPYNSQFSSDPSGLFIGESENSSEDHSDSVSLSLGIDMGVSGSLFGLLSGGVRTSIGQRVTQTYGEGFSRSVGRRFIVSPDPKTQGQSYGVVGLNCGCFHAYRYRVDDPTAKLGDGGDGEEFVMIIPVGGTSTLWSTKRYNAMAEAVGNLPVIPQPTHILGDETSYPNGPQKPNGDPIPKEDFLFEEVPSFLVSDVGKVGFWLSASEFEVNTKAVATDINIGADLGVGPFKFGTNIGLGVSSSYSLTAGKDVLFGGNVPAMPDDPDTPEDEYLENAFSFSAYVYQEHYEGPEGDDRAYYVLDYAVAEQ